MMNKRKPFTSIILLSFIGVISLFGFTIISERHTAHCPFDHWIRDVSLCFVLDGQGKRILIQRADLDNSSNNYIEMREDSKSTRSYFPNLSRDMLRKVIKQR
jgi:hypothetical protein